jgi:hypothetical protein
MLPNTTNPTMMLLLLLLLMMMMMTIPVRFPVSVLFPLPVFPLIPNPVQNGTPISEFCQDCE